MSDDESFNPYRAPENQEPQEVTLGEDAEFLISAREILCRETVHLPNVCIHTGETEDLVKRKKTFLPASRWINLFFALGLFRKFSSVGWLEFSILLMVVSITSSSVISKFKLPGVVNIEATWYVDQQYLHHCRWQNGQSEAPLPESYSFWDSHLDMTPQRLVTMHLFRACCSEPPLHSSLVPSVWAFE
jgi:hypothetical protein